MLSGQEKWPQKENRKYVTQHDSEIIAFENSDTDSDTDDAMKRKT
jgi:hypothetical protein